MVEIKEVLRLRLLGKGYRKLAELTEVDRKTVRRYIEGGCERRPNRVEHRRDGA